MQAGTHNISTKCCNVSTRNLDSEPCSTSAMFQFLPACFIYRCSEQTFLYRNWHFCCVQARIDADMNFNYFAQRDDLGVAQHRHLKMIKQIFQRINTAP